MRGHTAARCARIGHVAAEHVDLAGLDLPGAGDEAQQRRLADAVGPDQPDDAAGRKRQRHAVEGDRVAIPLRDIFEARDGAAARRSCTARLACNCGGQATAGSVRT